MVDYPHSPSLTTHLDIKHLHFWRLSSPTVDRPILHPPEGIFSREEESAVSLCVVLLINTITADKKLCICLTGCIRFKLSPYRDRDSTSYSVLHPHPLAQQPAVSNPCWTEGAPTQFTFIFLERDVSGGMWGSVKDLKRAMNPLLREKSTYA